MTNDHDKPPTGAVSAAVLCSAGDASEARQPEMLGNLNLAECYFIDGEGAHGMQPERGKILAYHRPTDELVFISPSGPFNLHISRYAFKEVADRAKLTEEQVDTLRGSAAPENQPPWRTVLG